MTVGFKDVAGDDNGTLAERWDGTTWTILPTPGPAGAAGGSGFGRVACLSSNWCMAVGEFSPTPEPHPGLSFSERWDGVSWTLQPTMNPAGTDEAPLGGLSCTSPSDCTAVGFYVDRTGEFRTLAEHWNGGAWTIQPTPTPPGAVFVSLGGVSCVPRAGCTAVGNVILASSVPLVLHSST
jgi:hypothetical protein